jgi:hypothetical protein
VADHPLRPATDHRLGRPLPHQQANPTRAPPLAINLSRLSLSEWPAYAVLAEVSLGYPPQEGRFPRATHPCATPVGRTRRAFDLHVLSMPPAFVLSQDQTLMFNPNRPAILTDSRPIVTGPAPAQRPDPKGHQTLTRYPHSTQSLAAPGKAVPRRATNSPQAAARASLLLFKI